MKRSVAGAAVPLAVLAWIALRADVARFIPRLAMSVVTLPIAVCQRLAVPPQPLLVVAGALLVALALAAFASALLQVRQTIRLVRRVDMGWSGAVPERVDRHSTHLGLEGKVNVAPSHAVFAFTHGLLRPRVMLSHGLVERLDDQELEAVLRHELAHARRRDPLRILIARSLARACTAVPAAPGALATYLCRLELSADRSVVLAMGDVLPLASALQRTLPGSPMPDLASAAVSGLSATDVRIDHLLGVSTPPRLVAPRVSRAHIAAFCFAIAAYFCLLIASAPAVSDIRLCIGC